MRKVVILSTPRCGTNLLMLSLDSHPDAVCAGEVCNADAEPDLWGHSGSRSEFIDSHNLFKVLSVYRSHSDFQQFLGWGFRVYLYREDIDAQKRSWIKAATTGVWMDGQSRPYIAPKPTSDYMDAEIAFADRMMMRQADLVLSYETMVSQWDHTTRTIQKAAWWPVKTLPMATEPTHGP